MRVCMCVCELLKPIEGSILKINETLANEIQKVNVSLNAIKFAFESKLEKQNIVINNLLTRVKLLEQQVKFNRHIAIMQARRIDDQEQTSRKVNLRLVGIEVSRNDCPEAILKVITDEMLALCALSARDIDRCHRIGRKYQKQGKTFQNVLVKMVTWNARDEFYKFRKGFSFKVSADLTSRRQELFNFALKEVSAGEEHPYVHYVYVDRNCKLKLKSTDNKFLGFNSEDEFFSVIYRLRFEHFATPQHLADVAGEREIIDCHDYYY